MTTVTERAFREVTNFCQCYSYVLCARFLILLVESVFENRVLGRILGPKREEVTRHWTRPRNEELHNLRSSPNIIRVVKSRTVRWSRHGRDEKCIQNFGQET